jgi:ABC-2 type transport system ATP-binding protein
LIGIIEKGRLLAQGTVKDVTRNLREQLILSVMVEKDVNTAVRLCREFPNVEGVTAAGNELRVVFAGTRAKVGDLNAKLVEHGIRVIGLREEESDLEEAFLHVTGKKTQAEAEAKSQPGQQPQKSQK